MPDYDPVKFVSGLSAKLATRSRHVCLFLGAGVARACNLPDVAELQTRVLHQLEEEEKKLFAALLEGRNLEQVLSRLRLIAALNAGSQTIDSMTSDTAAALDGSVCRAIVNELHLSGAELAPVRALAAWTARADYRLPLELFTVNYDLLLETALEELGVPYFDGFVGALQARFRTELVEATPNALDEWVPAFFVRLWKLHGSVNWAWTGDQNIVRLGQPVAEGQAAAIYPSDTKYEESRRVPFVVLHDRFRRAMNQQETLVLISGYSFSDAHLNEVIFDAAVRHERCEFIALCHSSIPSVLAQQAMAVPNIQVAGGHEAILSGVRGNWKAPEEAPPDLWADDQLALRDFRNLAAYLSRSVTREADWKADSSETTTLNRSSEEVGGSAPDA